MSLSTSVHEGVTGSFGEWPVFDVEHVHTIFTPLNPTFI